MTDDNFSTRQAKLQQALAAGLITPADYAALLGQKPDADVDVASGAAVIGDDNVALGERAVKVDGDVGGSINTGDTHYHGDKAPVEAGALQDAYCHYVLQTVGKLPLSGIDPKAAAEAHSQLELHAVYTALLTTIVKPMAHMSGADQLNQPPDELEPSGPRPIVIAPTVGKAVSSALEQLDSEPRFVLLGDPGSGKSTFVNFVALCMAGALLQHSALNLDLLTSPLPQDDGSDGEERQPWFHGPLLPVRVILRDFAARGLPDVGETGSATDLWDFIAAELTAHVPDFVEPLRAHLLNQGGLILLDGLDEVPAADQRRVQLKQVVEDFAACYPRCRFLVTSRTYAYQQQAWQLDGFESAVLRKFTEGQIRRFVDRWYAHIGTVRGWTPSNWQGRATLLKNAVTGNPRLQALAERPLLLTLMASLHAWRGGSLPEKREELYRDAVDLLLDWWESQRVVRDATGNVQVIQPSLAEWLKTDRDKVRSLLNRLAFEAHANQADLVGTADIPQSALLQGLLDLSANPDVRPQRLIEYLRDRAGLLLPRGVGVFTFPHRTFQEYLAACHLTDDEFPDKLAKLTRSEPNRWREVALLAGAKATRGMASAVWLLVDALCYAPAPQSRAVPARDADLWGAQIAGELLSESGAHLQTATRYRSKCDTVANWLVRVVRGAELPASERARAGRSVAVLGDPRPEVLTLDAMQFCLVPAGPFWMGSGDQDEQARDNEKPLHQLDLPYDYWIGRFPITNAQYAVFAATDESALPYALPAPFNLPNHPVVGVSWDQALAFTRWLTAQWQSTGQIPTNWRVQLPSEAEWEKAARGGIGLPQTPLVASLGGFKLVKPRLHPNSHPQRMYPWGAAFDVELANMEDSDIGATCAVGCFSAGASVYSCEGLSGNVFEWTRSRWGKGWQEPDFNYPYRLDDEREAVESRDLRVVRGGYYGGDAIWTRCAFRFWDPPGYRGASRGFRIVVSPFFPTLDPDASDL